jgi:hypothetical protein
MATSHILPSSHIIDDDAPVTAVPSRGRTLLHRLYKAMLETQSRRAQREIDRVLGPGALARAFSAELPPER